MIIVITPSAPISTRYACAAIDRGWKPLMFKLSNAVQHILKIQVQLFWAKFHHSPPDLQKKWRRQSPSLESWNQSSVRLRKLRKSQIFWQEHDLTPSRVGRGESKRELGRGTGEGRLHTAFKAFVRAVRKQLSKQGNYATCTIVDKGGITRKMDWLITLQVIWLQKHL